MAVVVMVTVLAPWCNRRYPRWPADHRTCGPRTLRPCAPRGSPRPPKSRYPGVSNLRQLRVAYYPKLSACAPRGISATARIFFLFSAHMLRTRQLVSYYEQTNLSVTSVPTPCTKSNRSRCYPLTLNNNPTPQASKHASTQARTHARARTLLPKK